MLEVEHLQITFTHPHANVKAVKDFSLCMEEGEVVGVVGESGSGKSITAHAIMGLLERNRVHVSGAIRFDGTDLLSLTPRQMQVYQGKDLSIIFQEPMTSLNPTMKIGRQVEEALHLHTKMNARERKSRALEAMALAGLSNPEELYAQYPHQLSGGMRQRVMIAAALVLRPRLLIADEPTTALDVTIQAQILETLKEINRKEGIAILFISHDLGVVRALCHRVLVMQKGEIVESGLVEQVFHHPQQAYTQRLIAARPTRTKLKAGVGDG